MLLATRTIQKYVYICPNTINASVRVCMLIYAFYIIRILANHLEDNKYSYMGGGRANEVSFGGIIAVHSSKEPWISEHAHLVYTIGPHQRQQRL